MQDSWQARWSPLEPIGARLRQDADGWVRFRSFPGSKRHAEVPSEHATILHRHNLVRPLPTTQVEPRRPAARLRSSRRGLDEAAIGNPDFDRGFRIRTADPAGLRHWFSPALIAVHLTGRVPSAWSVHGTEALRRQPGRLDPHDLGGLAPATLTLADLLDG
ncbi:hypothetical protein GCM10020358_65310 [Amorphoplanes nipponensis]|uniref:Uncharacterized protein n=1 Tax=Actinoplanes nipponensis TaxID=135950 RepID=A0A919JJ11_9ACTN|nr:hypothetical protein Ani05nite_51770 [Actinoplanes nipponensis]